MDKFKRNRYFKYFKQIWIWGSQVFVERCVSVWESPEKYLLNGSPL
jgi:hypothetical protein